jgi:hypothetical protein
VVISNLLLTKLKHLSYPAVPTSSFTYPVVISLPITEFQEENSFVVDLQYIWTERVKRLSNFCSSSTVVVYQPEKNILLLGPGNVHPREELSREKLKEKLSLPEVRGHWRKQSRKSIWIESVGLKHVKPGSNFLLVNFIENDVHFDGSGV